MTNATQLTGSVNVAAQGLYSESSTALHTVGSLIHSNDGRSFRYAKLGAVAAVPGQLYQAPIEDTTNQQNLTITNPAVGDAQIVTTTTVTLAVNALAGGTCVITTGSTNMGQIFRVKGNAVASGAALTVYLDDPVVYAPTGTAKIDIHLNPYNGVIVDPTTATSCPVGIPMFKITALYFGWLQTHGMAACLAQGALAVGESIVAANSTNAGAAAAASGVLPVIGYAPTGVASTEYGHVYLTID